MIKIIQRINSIIFKKKIVGTKEKNLKDKKSSKKKLEDFNYTMF